MSYLKERYCSIHQRSFYGTRCPQCVEDEQKKQYEKITEPIRRDKQKADAQQQLQLIFTKLENATLVRDMPDYKLLICPICYQPSLFFSKPKGKYECLNNKYGKCGLNSTIRLLNEQSGR